MEAFRAGRQSQQASLTPAGWPSRDNLETNAWFAGTLFRLGRTTLQELYAPRFINRLRPRPFRLRPRVSPARLILACECHDPSMSTSPRASTSVYRMLPIHDMYIEMDILIERDILIVSTGNATSETTTQVALSRGPGAPSFQLKCGQGVGAVCILWCFLVSGPHIPDPTPAYERG